MNNKTLAILKPDCVRKNLIGQVITKISDAGFKISAMKMLKLSTQTASGFYAIHRGKPFFNSLLDYMTSGNCIPLVLEKENAVEDFRKLIGATNPKNADEGTIRRLYAKDITENVIHGSDSDENAKKEIAYFFSHKEIIENL